MRMKSGVQQAVMSAAVFCGVLLALVSIDPRVRERLTDLITGGEGLPPFGVRVTGIGDALMTALRHQSIENAPLLVFVTVGAVLFVFMFRT
jgi:hypothetical protein